MKACKSITKISISQRDDYIACCSLDYPYFKENHRMIAIDLSKKQALDTDKYNSVNAKLSNSQLDK